MSPVTRAARGCLLGAAVGDSLCLPYEGLSRKRAERWLRGRRLRQRLVAGRVGMVSDDTDHLVFVSQALIRHAGEVELFQQALAWRLRWWLLSAPAGIGFATLRSTLRLWAGVPPERSGVPSAGNGAAMRSAIIGVVHAEDGVTRQRFVEASSRITHSDPRAIFAARAIADLAAYVTRQGGTKPALGDLRQILEKAGDGDKDWCEKAVNPTVKACELGEVESLLTEIGAARGVSGFVMQTVPVAVALWYQRGGDFRELMETVARLGGDTDTVAAIAGALSGITLGEEGIPSEWIEAVWDFPHDPAYLRTIGDGLGKEKLPPSATRFSGWLFARGPIFAAAILAAGFRRVFPPYG
ncbi:MAG: ADP-ribosylglycohydrolase family protein [Verrucomicrobiota bacterium]